MVLAYKSVEVVVKKVLATGQGDTVPLFLSGDCVANVDVG